MNEISPFNRKSKEKLSDRKDDGSDVSSFKLSKKPHTKSKRKLKRGKTPSIQTRKKMKKLGKKASASMS